MKKEIDKTPRVLWVRNDGVTRVALSFFGENKDHPALSVENQHTNAMGEMGWEFCDREVKVRDLETLALMLLGLDHPSSHGFPHGSSGKLTPVARKMAREGAHKMMEDIAELLDGIQWYQPHHNGQPSCPNCLNFEEEGHTADCGIAAFLKEHPPV